MPETTKAFQQEAAENARKGGEKVQETLNELTKPVPTAVQGSPTTLQKPTEVKPVQK